MKLRLMICLALVGFGCADKEVIEEDLTGIELTVQHASSLGLDQLKISGMLDGAEAFAEGRLPETPAAIAGEQSTLVIILPDDLGGKTIAVRVDGLAAEAIVATATLAVAVPLRALAEASTRLGTPAVCGDGTIRDRFEVCDDGGVDAGDGCSAQCEVEPGWTCAGAPSVCVRCGNEVVDPEEQCDDGNQAEGDGCSPGCAVENGYACTGAPSVCSAICGDGIVLEIEECDDNNTATGDGCDDLCAPEPGYTCVGEPSSCTCAGDVDVDGIADCEDPCLDADFDGYGRPGGDPAGCLGDDCDDLVPTCTVSCDANLDADEFADCADTCIDMDGDQYGVAGGAGNECLGEDCWDGSSLCTTECIDTDGDATFTCADDCIDVDGDDYGIDGGGGTCQFGADCNDASTLCTTICNDIDNDNTDDCEDPCIDVDGDTFGQAAANMACALDCDDGVVTCTNVCVDADADLVFDCADDCIDVDGDTYGVDGGGGTCPLGPDCNDAASTCTNNCGVDVDTDTFDDCLDLCVDFDMDTFGRDSPNRDVNGCPLDCDDTQNACNVDCSGCQLPQQLVITATSPQTLCVDANLDISLDTYGGAAADIACTATTSDQAPVTHVAADFEAANDGGFDATTNGATTLFSGAGFPASCGTVGSFIQLDSGGSRLARSAQLDARGYEDLELSFTVGFRAPVNGGSTFTVLACCAGACIPNVPIGTVAPGVLGGTDDCRTETFQFPAQFDDCSTFDLHFDWSSPNGEAAIDDIVITGSPRLRTAVTEFAPAGSYRATIASCAPASIVYQCTWDDGTNPTLSDSTLVNYQ